MAFYGSLIFSWSFYYDLAILWIAYVQHVGVLGIVGGLTLMFFNWLKEWPHPCWWDMRCYIRSPWQYHVSFFNMMGIHIPIHINSFNFWWRCTKHTCIYNCFYYLGLGCLPLVLHILNSIPCFRNTLGRCF